MYLFETSSGSSRFYRIAITLSLIYTHIYLRQFVAGTHVLLSNFLIIYLKKKILYDMTLKEDAVVDSSRLRTSWGWGAVGSP